MERVNRFFGYPAVTRLAIRQGMVPARARAAAPPRPLAPVSAEMGESLRDVQDQELKAVLTALARGVATPDAEPVRALPIRGRIS